MKKIKTKVNKIYKGQSLFEVVVAIGITALVLVGALSLSSATVRNSNFARNNSVATKFAQGGIEYVREQRDESWSDFYSQTGTKNLGSLNWPPGGSCNIPAQPVFCRKVTLTAVSSNQVNVSVTVTWTDGQGDHTVRSATTFTRWR